MSRRPIGVTASEMMTLRNAPYNLTNVEIAKQLDISLQTVYRYIGKQNTKPQKPAPKPVNDDHVWDTAQSLTRLGYGNRTYLINTYNQRVELERPLTVLTPDDVHRMLNELTYIEQLLERARKEGKIKCK